MNEANIFRLAGAREIGSGLIYRKTGNLRAVQLFLGYTKIDSTVRYLGVEVEDALSSAEKIDIRTLGERHKPFAFGKQPFSNRRLMTTRAHSYRCCT